MKGLLVIRRRLCALGKEDCLFYLYIILYLYLWEDTQVEATLSHYLGRKWRNAINEVQYLSGSGQRGGRAESRANLDLFLDGNSWVWTCIVNGIPISSVEDRRYWKCTQSSLRNKHTPDQNRYQDVSMLGYIGSDSVLKDLLLRTQLRTHNYRGFENEDAVCLMRFKCFSLIASHSLGMLRTSMCVVVMWHSHLH